MSRFRIRFIKWYKVTQRFKKLVRLIIVVDVQVVILTAMLLPSEKSSLLNMMSMWFVIWLGLKIEKVKDEVNETSCEFGQRKKRE